MTRPKILFVCLGNICRSPTAEAIFRHRADLSGLDVMIDSAGTGGWHAGEPPDPRTIQAGEQRGYSFAHQKSRKIRPSDFETFDYILAMDRRNLTDLQTASPPQYRAKITLFLDYASSSVISEVPDPYYGGSNGFETVLDLIEEASDGLIAKLR